MTSRRLRTPAPSVLFLADLFCRRALIENNKTANGRTAEWKKRRRAKGEREAREGSEKAVRGGDAATGGSSGHSSEETDLRPPAVIVVEGRRHPRRLSLERDKREKREKKSAHVFRGWSARLRANVGSKRPSSGSQALNTTDSSPGRPLVCTAPRGVVNELRVMPRCSRRRSPTGAVVPSSPTHADRAAKRPETASLP